jgi:hypothetical protein
MPMDIRNAITSQSSRKRLQCNFDEGEKKGDVAVILDSDGEDNGCDYLAAGASGLALAFQLFSGIHC